MDKQRAKIIAVDFDGTLVTDKFPLIGDPILKNIERVKEEQANGADIILWTCRTGYPLMDAVYFCRSIGIELAAINEGLPHVEGNYKEPSRKIFADEYWDDRAVHMSEKDIGDFSDGYHTFNDLYKQRLILTAALFNTYTDHSWKSRKHADGKKCFGGGWFIVGIDTPEGSYTYHYENEHWDKFKCRELDMAPEWDGHTDKDVDRLMSIIKEPKETDEYSMMVWAKREIDISCARERADSGVDEGEWDYGCSCFDSAMKAFKSLCNDGHSGFSIVMTKNILNRLIDGKPLSPIVDTPDIWSDIVDRDSEDGVIIRQCKRMYSLFKHEYPDGRVEYHDNDSYYCVDVDTGSTYTNGITRTLLHELFPITMPYMPGDRLKVYCQECLTDNKNGDFDTVAVLYIVHPDGKRTDVNRFFKETETGWADITEEEYAERWAQDLAREDVVVRVGD